MARWPDDIDREVLGAIPEDKRRPTKEEKIAAREEKQVAVVEAQTVRSLVAIALMLIGGTIASVGAGFEWGWPVGLICIGLVVLINGILIGM